MSLALKWKGAGADAGTFYFCAGLTLRGVPTDEWSEQEATPISNPTHAGEILNEYGLERGEVTLVRHPFPDEIEPEPSQTFATYKQRE